MLKIEGNWEKVRGKEGWMEEAPFAACPLGLRAKGADGAYCDGEAFKAIPIGTGCSKGRLAFHFQS